MTNKKRGLILTPSLMCAEYQQLESVVKTLDQAGADAFHIDVMDGHYVQNFGMGPQDIKAIRESTRKILDVHLMILNPENHLDLFIDLGADIIYFHPDSTIQPYSVLDKIKKSNIKCGIAISPGVSINSVESLILDADYILLMTVNPGFSGQKYIDSMERKIDQIQHLTGETGPSIIVDGALSKKNIELLIKKNVSGYVLGTSILFKKDYEVNDYKKVFNDLKEIYENK